MNEELSFLAEIAVDPRADTVRQVFADWLEERGEPKSAVFRNTAGPSSVAGRLLSEDLEQSFEWELLQPIRAALGPELDRAIRKYGLDRGLPLSASMDTGAFLRYAPRIFQAWPWLAAIELFMQEELDSAFWDRINSTQLKSLAIRNLPSERLVIELLQSPRTSQLRELDLSFNTLSTETAAALASASLMNRLESLKLADCELDPLAAEYFGSAAWPSLRGLDLSNNYLGREGLRLLFDGVWLESLEHLHLAFNEIDPAAAFQLQNIPPQAALRSLDLSANLIGNVGLEEIAQIEGWENLNELSLSDNGLTAAGVERLVRAAWWPQLTSLSLAMNQFGDEALRDLCRKGANIRLEELNLTATGLGDDGLARLSKSRAFPELARLIVTDNAFTADGARTLLGGRPWPKLASLSMGGAWGYFGPATAQVLSEELPRTAIRRLELLEFQGGSEVLKSLTRGAALAKLQRFHLRASEVGDDGAIALANCPAAAGLTVLDLSGNHLTERGASALAESPYLTELRWLDLSSNRISDDGLKSLANGSTLQKLTRLKLESNPVSKSAVGAFLGPEQLPKLLSVTDATGIERPRADNRLWLRFDVRNIARDF